MASHKTASTPKTKKAVHFTDTSTSSTGSILPQERYPLLAKTLLDTPGVSKVAPTAETRTSTTTVRSAISTINLSGPKTTPTLKTSKSTSWLSQRLQPSRSKYYGDSNSKRGERITTQTLAQYLQSNRIYTAEDFLDHATQRLPNRGTEIYLALATRDWDKKIQQALDIARSFTPDTTYRNRLENYRIPEDFDQTVGDYTFQEYMDLFSHHAIDRSKIQKWFATLFSDNGKRNTIYMYGKADAGKTTIIKLFDAFYESWEIGRCSAQSINSNFWLQDLYLKRLFHADEILATQVNIDTLKLLLEGSDDLTTDIKYAKKVTVKGRPVMMATNDPIWIHMSSAQDPIRRRCEWVHMTRPWNKRVLFMHTKDKRILKYVLNRLYKWAFPQGYNLWKNDTQFMEAIHEIDDSLLAMHGSDNSVLEFASEMN